MANKSSRNRGIRLRNGIWYVNIQAGTKRKEFRVGPNKEDATASAAQV